MDQIIDGIKVKPCVGCGYCCLTARCCASIRIWPSSSLTECPALIWKDNRYICELMTMSGRMGIEYRAELFAGEGCCSSLNSWRNDIQPRREKDNGTVVKYKLDKPFAAFVRSLGGNFFSGDALFLSLLGMKNLLEKDGYPEDEIEAIVKEVQYEFSNFRTSFMRNFIG